MDAARLRAAKKIISMFHAEKNGFILICCSYPHYSSFVAVCFNQHGMNGKIRTFSGEMLSDDKRKETTNDMTTYISASLLLVGRL
jgi:hypothetical protein